jgi:hypothetical protein
MRRPRLITRKWLIPPAIVLILIALGIWTIRPVQFGAWLGLSGLLNATPLELLEDWAKGRLAPMTPTGFFSLFPVADLAILVALLIALFILVVLVQARWRDERYGTWLTARIVLFRQPDIRMRVRAMMALIAILGLDLGWEIVGWRNWRLSERYRLRAAVHSQEEAQYRAMLQNVERRLAALDTRNRASSENALTSAALAAQMAYSRDTWIRQAAEFARLAASSSELRREYERAALNPSQRVPSDLRVPELPFESDYEMYGRDHARALAKAQILIRLYPDLVQPHERRAWILATCPDPKVRDGKLAVAEAKRAYELTKGNSWQVLSTLAAAHAEAGDFASAVRWEQRALEKEQLELDRYVAQMKNRPGMMGMEITSKPNPDRLNLYKAGKPYRMRR